MLYQICNGRVEFAAATILENINFEIKNTKEKIAVVGRNGCGKTTLLKLISGEIALTRKDGDTDVSIVKAGSPAIGYLKQITFEDESLTLDAEIRKVFAGVLSMQTRLEELVVLMEKNTDEKLVEEYTHLQEEFQDIGGYYYEKEYDMMLKNFGFELSDKQKHLSEFSGGQRTKLAFIKLLLSKPDILLLDEPTNHLDITAIEWLEGYLKTYSRAVVIVSHDRMFLDKIVDTVYEIEYQTIKRYSGNYSDFMKQKRVNYEKQMKDYAAQQKEIERLMTLAERFKNKPTKVAMARSKLKMIEHMEILEAPDKYDTKTFHASFEPAHETGKDVLSVRKLQIGYNKVLSEVTFELKRGQRLGIIGGNGLGKSTLLKTLVGVIPALSGEYSYGVNVETGYFDQQMAQYSSGKTVLDDFWDEFPTLTQTEARNCLGAFLFTKEDVFKTVKMLSGGERVRLALAKIFKRKPNVLILDEPTNHMDIVGKETLEAMLCDFPGTVIFVSHDRYFIKQVSDVLLVLDEEGSKFYTFGYEEYMEEQEKLKAGENVPVRAQGIHTADSKTGTVTGQSEDGTADKPAAEKAGMQSYQAGKELARLIRKIEKTEEQLCVCEAEIQKKKDELQDPALASDYKKLQEMQQEIDEKEEQLLVLMAEWDELISERDMLQ